MVGRFEIRKVVRIERKDDSNSISEKWADYSQATISTLIKDGIKDTIYTLLSEIGNKVNQQLLKNFKEAFFKILIDKKYGKIEKSSLLYEKLVLQLELKPDDHQEIKKAIDSLIEATEIYNDLN